MESPKINVNCDDLFDDYYPVVLAGLLDDEMSKKGIFKLNELCIQHNLRFKDVMEIITEYMKWWNSYAED